MMKMSSDGCPFRSSSFARGAHHYLCHMSFSWYYSIMNMALAPTLLSHQVHVPLVGFCVCPNLSYVFMSHSGFSSSTPASSWHTNACTGEFNIPYGIKVWMVVWVLVLQLPSDCPGCTLHLQQLTQAPDLAVENGRIHFVRTNLD